MYKTIPWLPKLLPLRHKFQVNHISNLNWCFYCKLCIWYNRAYFPKHSYYSPQHKNNTIKENVKTAQKKPFCLISNSHGYHFHTLFFALLYNYVTLNRKRTCSACTKKIFFSANNTKAFHLNIESDRCTYTISYIYRTNQTMKRKMSTKIYKYNKNKYFTWSGVRLTVNNRQNEKHSQ